MSGWDWGGWPGGWGEGLKGLILPLRYTLSAEQCSLLAAGFLLRVGAGQGQRRGKAVDAGAAAGPGRACVSAAQATDTWCQRPSTVVALIALQKLLCPDSTCVTQNG